MSGEVGAHHFYGVVEIQVVAGGGGGGNMNVDFVVDSNGQGTHLLLFGPTGALEEAIGTHPDGVSKTIWICTTHYEVVEDVQYLPALSNDQRITVLSAGRHRPIINVGAGVGVDGLIHVDVDNSGTAFGSGSNTHLRFEGWGVRRNTGDPSSASAGPLFMGSQGSRVPNLEFIDFTMTGNQWTVVLDFNTVDSATVAEVIFDGLRTEGAMTALWSVATVMATTGKLVLKHCDIDEIDCIEFRGNATDLNLGTLYSVDMHHNHFDIINGSSGSDRDEMGFWASAKPFNFSDNTVKNFKGVGAFITLGPGAPSEDIINDNSIYCSSAGACAVQLEGSGTAENVSIVGNTLRGPGSGTAIKFDMANQNCAVYNSYRDWDTNVGGTDGLGPGSDVGPHDLLSDKHSDTTPKTPPDDGDLIYGNTGLWVALPVGASPDDYVLTLASGLPAWMAAAAGYSDEQAQDAVGAILVDSAQIDFTYDDATPSITAVLVPLDDAYTVTNGTTDRTYDANSTTIDELADIVATLLADLKAYGLLP